MISAGPASEERDLVRAKRLLGLLGGGENGGGGLLNLGGLLGGLGQTVGGLTNGLTSGLGRRKRMANNMEADEKEFNLV